LISKTLKTFSTAETFGGVGQGWQADSSVSKTQKTFRRLRRLEAWGKAGGRRGVGKCCLGDWGGVLAAMRVNFVAVSAFGLCRVLGMGISDVGHELYGRRKTVGSWV
jgi:hypothetical protein